MTELMAEDEHAPMSSLSCTRRSGVGAAAGPFHGAIRTLGAAERLQAAL